MRAGYSANVTPGKMVSLIVPETPIKYTKEKHGQVPSVYVKYLQDQTLLLQAQDYIVNNHGPFSEVIEIDDGHFSFWSKADEFTELFLSLADKYVTHELHLR